MLHRKTVEPATLELLNSLMQLPQLNDFLLVGGTSLSLQIGHRKSIDLDLFSSADFDENGLLSILQDNYKTEISDKGIRTLNLRLNGIKVDILGYKYPLLENPLIEDSIRMMGRKDIGAMKLGAISGRGAKKDFYDLFYLLKEFSIEQLLDFYKQKYNITDIFHVLKSINYFNDAEEDADPFCFEKITWKQIKADINKQVKDYISK